MKRLILLLGLVVIATAQPYPYKKGDFYQWLRIKRFIWADSIYANHIVGSTVVSSAYSDSSLVAWFAHAFRRGVPTTLIMNAGAAVTDTIMMVSRNNADTSMWVTRADSVIHYSNRPIAWGGTSRKFNGFTVVDSLQLFYLRMIKGADSLHKWPNAETAWAGASGICVRNDTFGWRWGTANVASGFKAAVTGGQFDTASGAYAFIGGGLKNTATDSFATVLGGFRNQATAKYSTISGGQYNNLSGSNSFIIGGQRNRDSAYSSGIIGDSARIPATDTGAYVYGVGGPAGGREATPVMASSKGPFSHAFYAGKFVGGLFRDSVVVPSALSITPTPTIGDTSRSVLITQAGKLGTPIYKGVGLNDITFQGDWRGRNPIDTLFVWLYATGASKDSVKVKLSRGGSWSAAWALTAATKAAVFNTYAYAPNCSLTAAAATGHTVGDTWILPVSSPIPFEIRAANGAVMSKVYPDGSNVTGLFNTASGTYSTVSGGYANTTSGIYSTVSGGYTNIALGGYSTIAGGIANAASGVNSFISGGQRNRDSAYNSGIVGDSARIPATDTGAYVYGVGGPAGGREGSPVMATSSGPFTHTFWSGKKLLTLHRDSVIVPGALRTGGLQVGDTFLVRAGGGAAFAALARFSTYCDSAAAVDTIQLSGLTTPGTRVRILNLSGSAGAGTTDDVVILNGTAEVVTLTARNKWCDLELIAAALPRWYVFGSN